MLKTAMCHSINCATCGKYSDTLVDGFTNIRRENLVRVWPTRSGGDVTVS